MSELTGRTLGQYEIIEKIGHGGMANVYRAVQPSIGREVAIKVLPAHFLQDPTFLERFMREVQVITQLQHPHILTVHDFGEQDGLPYIVMAYMPGGTLADRIREAERGLPLDEVSFLVDQIAEALDFAHSEGIIHRDFKPSNVLLDRHGNTYLADFGIAKAIEATAQLTGSGMVGTPAYMAPEMAERGGITPLIDVYALGVMLFQMLTSQPPYDAETPMGLLMAHMGKPIPDLREYRPGLPDALQAIINRAMAKNPAARYQSPGELADDLRAAAEGLAQADFDPPTETQPLSGEIPAIIDPNTQPIGVDEATPAVPYDPTTQPLAPSAPTPPDVPTMDAIQQEAETVLPSTRRRVPIGALVGGAAAVIAVIVIVLLATGVLGGGARGDGSEAEETLETAEPAEEAAIQPTNTIEPTSMPTEEPTPTPEPTQPPTETPQPTATPTPEPIQGPAIIGAGQQVYGCEIGISDYAICISNLDGSGEYVLFNSPGIDLLPDVSPDGTRIIFSSDLSGNREIYVMNATGANLVNLTNNPARDLEAVWSPDGTRIAFLTDRDWNIEIYVMNADGSNPINLTNHYEDDTYGRDNFWWSDDGTQIFFRSGRHGNETGDWDVLYVANADGTGAWRVEE
jgi:serine/threonine-protein kinase